MKQLSNHPSNTIDFNSFEPVYTDGCGDKYLKPIGLRLTGFGVDKGDKSLLIKGTFDGSTVNHLSTNHFQDNNSYARDIPLSGVKDYLKKKMDSFDIFVFEDSKELLKWLGE